VHYARQAKQAVIGKAIEDYTTLDGTRYTIAKDNSVRATTWRALYSAIEDAAHSSEESWTLLLDLLVEIRAEMSLYGWKADAEGTVVIHLVHETFEGLHIDADEHLEEIGGMTQLTLGIPFGRLISQTAGLHIPGADGLFTFSVPKPETESRKADTVEHETLSVRRRIVEEEWKRWDELAKEADAAAANSRGRLRLAQLKLGSAVMRWKQPSDVLIDVDASFVVDTVVNMSHIKQTEATGTTTH
jgi:hypothetical protein